MKTLLTLLIFLSLTFNLQAQRPWKEYLIPGSAMLFSGMVEGVDESTMYHYDDGFKRVFPNASDRFWNPAVSWRNKFKNGQPSQGEAFWGSTDLFVAFTDGHHFLRNIHMVTDLGASIYIMNHHYKHNKQGKLNWKTILQDFLVLSTIRTIGFHITYEHIFKGDPSYLKHANGN